MSFWDRYLAPGDVRNARSAIQSPAESIDSTPHTPVQAKKPVRLDVATRARRQNGLLIGGAVFSILSVLITRRAVARKIQSAPALAATSGATSSTPTVAGGLDAAEALSFATLNVFSFGLLGMGAAMKILDVADIEDLREKVRRGIGYDVYGGDATADKELEEWVAELLTKKDIGLKAGLVEKLAELEKFAKDKPKE